MTPADFRLAFPAFVNETNDVIQAQINASAPYFDVARWGAFFTDGQGNWVAHMIAINKADSVTIEANDVLARDTEHVKIVRSPDLVKMQSKDPFMRTTWGQRYCYLRKLVGIGAMAV